MPNQEHVPKQETCERLKELGFPQDKAAFYYVVEGTFLNKDPLQHYSYSTLDGENIHDLIERDKDALKVFTAAPLATELLEWLPLNDIKIEFWDSDPKHRVSYDVANGRAVSCLTLPEALAQMLICLVENKIVSFEGVNVDA